MGFADYGIPDATAVLWCYGGPGSRLESAYLRREANEVGPRIIGIDRPGYGLSTPQRAEDTPGLAEPQCRSSSRWPPTHHVDPATPSALTDIHQGEARPGSHYPQIRRGAKRLGCVNDRPKLIRARSRIKWSQAPGKGSGADLTAHRYRVRESRR